MMAAMSRAKPLFHTEPDPSLPNRLAELEAVGEAIGMPLLPWAARALAVATEYDPETEEPHRRRVLATIPRQSGKSIAVATVAIEWGLRTPEGWGIYAGQTREAGRNRLASIARLLRVSGLDPGAKFTRGVGNERLLFSNGAVIEVVSPNATSVHGESVDLAILDELWAIEPHLLSAVTPAMAARPKAQLWMISTAGTVADSLLLNDLRDRGRADPNGPMAFIEYTKPDEIHPLDEEGWASFHPGLFHTIDVKHLRDEAAQMPLSEFARAYCNQTTAVDALAFPKEWFERSSLLIAAPESIVVGIDASKLGAAVASAFVTEDGWHADPIEYREGRPDWLIERLGLLADRFRIGAIGYDASGPLKQITPELTDFSERSGIPLRSFSAADRCHADAWLFGLLKDEQMTHGDLPALTEAVGSTPSKVVGDLWRFDREKAVSDASPLIALSLAAYVAYETEILAPRPAIFFG
jgi:hypothetical protein